MTIGVDTASVNCTAYSNNGQLLVTGASDGYIRIYGMWNSFREVVTSIIVMFPKWSHIKYLWWPFYVTDGGQQECVHSWAAHTGDVYTVVFSPDLSSVYSMGADGKVHCLHGL